MLVKDMMDMVMLDGSMIIIHHMHNIMAEILEMLHLVFMEGKANKNFANCQSMDSTFIKFESKNI